jgi:hypothetical protein
MGPRAGLDAGENKNLFVAGIESLFSYYSASGVDTALTELPGSSNNLRIRRHTHERSLPPDWPHRRDIFGSVKLCLPSASSNVIQSRHR